MSLRGHGTIDAFFGDGSDGDVQVTSIVDLTRDMFYETLVMSGTSSTTPHINTNSFRIYVRDRLIFITSGTIANDGVSGSAGFGGKSPRPSGMSGSLASYGDGGDGGIAPGDGQNGVSIIGYGGSGGDGGAFVPGGSDGGIVTAPDPSSGSILNSLFSFLGYTFGSGSHSVAGGGGGGGGGSDLTSISGSGGGGGGGVLLVVAKEILIGRSGTYIETSSFSPGLPFSGTVAPFSGTFFTTRPYVTATFAARGGAGERGITDQPAGGGGGGGVVMIVTSTPSSGQPDSSYLSASDSATFKQPSNSGSLEVNVNGGPGGSSPAAVGTAGSIGSFFVFRV